MYVEGEVQDLFQGVSHRGGEEKSGPRLVKAGRGEEPTLCSKGRYQ